jgi:hypothetical protein
MFSSRFYRFLGIIDSGATNHVCYSLQGFQERRRLNKNEIKLRLGNGTLVSASAVGDIRVYLDSRMHLDLIDVRFTICIGLIPLQNTLCMY